MNQLTTTESPTTRMRNGAVYTRKSHRGPRAGWEKATGLEADRIRFNWGFHDGAGEQERGVGLRNMDLHFDPTYADGYRRGVEYASQGLKHDDSAQAWQESGRVGSENHVSPYRA